MKVTVLITIFRNTLDQILFSLLVVFSITGIWSILEVAQEFIPLHLPELINGLLCIFFTIKIDTFNQ